MRSPAAESFKATETILDTFAVQFLFKGDRRALDRWEQGFKNVNRQINNVARTATLAGGALTAALFGVGRTIVGFEQTMNNLHAVLNASSEDMERLRNQAMELGSSTAFSASQVGDAQTELALIFGDVERTTKALPDVLNLASAGQLEMGEAAKLVGSQMNAFGLTVDDTQRIVDVLAKAASSGATTVRELAPALRQVAPAAKLANLSIERTAAFIVALRDIGLQAEQAGTAFRNIIVRLTESRPAQDFLVALSDIGVRFEDLKALAQRGEYEEIFRRLGDAGLDAATAISLFGTEGFSAGANLSESISKVDALTESLIGAEGWAERMRLIQEQGLPGAIAAFRSALEGLQLELGSAGLTNWIAAAADALRGFVLWLRDASGWVKTTMAIVLASGPVLLGLAAFLKLVTFALSGLVPLLKIAAWANKQFGISTTFAAIANSKFVLSLKATRIGMLLTAAAARVTWASILGPVAALAAVGFAVFKFRRQILSALKAVWSWAKENWPLLVGLLFGPFGIAAGLIFKFRDDIVDAIMWIKDKVTAIFTALRDFVIGIWQGLGAAIGGAFRGVINGVVDGLNKALEVAASLIEAIKGALDKIPGPNPAGDFLLDVASKLRAGIPNFAIGGMVPGATGRPMLATVHGGEMVLPPSAWQVVMDLFEGFKRGPNARPQAPPGYAQMYRSSVVNRSVTVNITEPIVIHTQATDAKGIAQELGEAIQDQIQNVAYDHDGPVER